MNEEDMIFENEGEAPDNWESNTILVLNEQGELVELNIPDDKEV